MAFSMAGLASTMQGVDIAERQQQADALAANNAKREEVKFKQEQQSAATQAASDAIVLGKEADGLGSATAKAQTNGQRLMNSVLGLFSSQKSGDTAAQQPASAGINAVPSYGAPTQQTEQSVTPAQADTPAAGNIAAASPAATALPAHRQAQARLDAYALKNPNDLKVIQATQEKIDGMAIKHRTGLAQRTYEDISLGRNPVALKELYNEHVHDGKTAEEIRYVDENTVAVKLSDGTIFQRPMANIKDFLLQLQKPGSSADLHLQKLTESAKAEGKLPSEIELKNVESKNKIAEQDAELKGETKQQIDNGSVELNRAHVRQINNTVQNSNLDHADKSRIKALTDAVAKTEEGSPEEKSALRALQLAAGTYGKAEGARYDSHVAEGRLGVLDRRTGVVNWNDPNAPDKPVGTAGVKQGAPKVGDVVDVYKFRGGNPASQSSWEPVANQTAAPMQSAQHPTQADANHPAQNGLSGRAAVELFAKARAIKAKYKGSLPSRYMGNSLSDSEQQIIDAADKISATWGRY